MEIEYKYTSQINKSDSDEEFIESVDVEPSIDNPKSVTVKINQPEQPGLPYKWEQTLEDVLVTVLVPKGTPAKSVNCKITKTHLIVGIKGEKPIIDGDLSEPVKAGD